MSRTTGLPLEEISEDDMVIAFMGPTGTGKSTFIDLLARQEGLRSGRDIESVTHQVDAICVLHPYSGERVILVDTPGFDDTHMGELEVLELIADWLRKTYKLNIKLFGIIFLHSIADRRMKGSTLKNLHMFERLCGELAMASVVFTTTMWKDVTPEDGLDREAQLISKFWQPMIDQGATVDRLRTTTYHEAWRVMHGLIEKRSGEGREALLLQVELVEMKRKLNETQAGKELYASIKDLLSKVEKRRKTLRDEKRGARDPAVVRELDAELREIESRTAKAKEDAARLKIPFHRRLQSFLDTKPDNSSSRPSSFIFDHPPPPPPPTKSTSKQSARPHLVTDTSSYNPSRGPYHGNAVYPRQDMSSAYLGVETPAHYPQKITPTTSAESSSWRTPVTAPPSSTYDEYSPYGPSYHDRERRTANPASNKVQNFPGQSHGFIPPGTTYHQDVQQDRGHRVPYSRETDNRFSMQGLLDSLPTSLQVTMGPADAQILADYLDSVLEDERSSDRRSRLLNFISQIAMTTHVYPQRVVLQPFKNFTGSIGAGTFGDVHRELTKNSNACVKIIKRPFPNEKSAKLHIKEVVLWFYLSHPNILPLCGLFSILSNPSPRTCLVLPWMKNENIKNYTATRSQKDRMPLLHDVSEGLVCLHKLGITHGNIKSQNIIISNDGRALITDIASSHFGMLAPSNGPSQAPTPLNFPLSPPEAYRNTLSQPGDIWSFGSLYYEILSRRLPFEGFDVGTTIRMLCNEGRLPERPRSSQPGFESIGSDAWELISACWDFDPQARPDCRGIRKMAARLVTSDHRPSARLVARPYIEYSMQPQIDPVRAEYLLRKLQEQFPPEQRLR